MDCSLCTSHSIFIGNLIACSGCMHRHTKTELARLNKSENIHNSVKFKPIYVYREMKNRSTHNTTFKCNLARFYISGWRFVVQFIVVRSLFSFSPVHWPFIQLHHMKWWCVQGSTVHKFECGIEKDRRTHFWAALNGSSPAISVEPLLLFTFPVQHWWWLKSVYRTKNA